MDCTRTQLKRKPNTKIFDYGDRLDVQLHETVVFSLDKEARTLRLKTGGWHTQTTFRRINECLQALNVNVRRTDKPYKISKHDFEGRDSIAFEVSSLQGETWDVEGECAK